MCLCDAKDFLCCANSFVPFSISFSYYGDLVFCKDLGIMREKYTSDCAEAVARKIAMHSTLLLWVDGKPATLHKAIYPALRVDFGSNQAMWQCSHAKLAA